MDDNKNKIKKLNIKIARNSKDLLLKDNNKNENMNSSNNLNLSTENRRKTIDVQTDNGNINFNSQKKEFLFNHIHQIYQKWRMKIYIFQ